MKIKKIESVEKKCRKLPKFGCLSLTPSKIKGLHDKQVPTSLPFHFGKLPQLPKTAICCQKLAFAAIRCHSLPFCCHFKSHLGCPISVQPNHKNHKLSYEL